MSQKRGLWLAVKRVEVLMVHAVSRAQPEAAADFDGFIVKTERVRIASEAALDTERKK